MKVLQAELKRTAKLAIPMVATQLLWMTMPIVDNMLVGHLGEIPLAAMAIATTFYWLLQLVCLGILSALNPLISHAFGRGESKDFRSLLQSALFLGGCLAFLMVALLISGESILLKLGQNPKLLSVSKEYLLAVVWGVPFHLGFIVFRQFCDSVENPKPSIVLVAVASVLNAVLGYLLIYGKMGFPALGIRGCGLATAFAQFFLCVGLGSYLSFSKKYRIYEFWKKKEIRLSWVYEMLRIGIPSSGSMLAEMIYFSGSTLIMGLIGATEVASHQIALNVASTTFMIPLGVSFAISVRVGGYAGREDWAGVRLAGKSGFLLCSFLGIANALGLLLFARQIVHLYTTEPAVEVMAVTLVRIAGVFQIFDGLQVVGIYALRGLKDTRIPFVVTILSYGVIGMATSLWMTFGLQKGPVGFWMGMILALAVAATLHQLRFKKISAK